MTHPSPLLSIERTFQGPLRTVWPAAHVECRGSWPIADIKVLTDPEKNLLVIMRDGRIYKNALRN